MASGIVYGHAVRKRLRPNTEFRSNMLDSPGAQDEAFTDFLKNAIIGEGIVTDIHLVVQRMMIACADPRAFVKTPMHRLPD